MSMPNFGVYSYMNPGLCMSQKTLASYSVDRKQVEEMKLEVEGTKTIKTHLLTYTST